MLLHVSFRIILQHLCFDMECKTYILNDLQRKTNAFMQLKKDGVIFARQRTISAFQMIRNNVSMAKIDPPR